TFLAGKLLGAMIPPSMGDWVVEPHLSWRVLIFALVATTLCLILIGLAPSILVSRADPNHLLKSGSGTGATKRNRRRYGILVGLEIALALGLSSAAAITVRAALRTRGLSVGFDPRPLATGYISRAAPAGTVLRYSDLLQSTAARVRAVDGVLEASAYTSGGPFDGGAVTVEDPGGVREFVAPGHVSTMVSPSYFRTMQLSMARGRDFIDGERDAGAVIVDEQTAHALWPNADPVGAQIKFGDLKSTQPYVRVVGVVGQQRGFEGDRAVASFLRGVRQLGRIYYLPGPTDSLIAAKFGAPYVNFVARAGANAETLPVTLRRSFFAAGDVRTLRVVSMDESMGLTAAREGIKFVSSLFGLFAALGVALAAFGVYGVVAHSVAERRREFGVRIALGATARDILRAVLRESAVVALAGVALGLLATKFELPFLQVTVFEDDLYNAPLFALVAFVLAATTAAAALVPALRATRVDPTESLRND
ncbi:MAG TPA: FtsX-like permease family protein, partial [Gemmatimonadaceae bacterium]|nr:FtsX-like permease family protein [Gemmatimonadaceae bacterium]